MTISNDYLSRLDAVEARLNAAAESAPPPDALTGADPKTGEQWDRGQVWAHVSEFIPYWIAQAAPVLRGQTSGDPVPFGRTHSDPERLGAIERDRREAVAVLWADTRKDIANLRVFLAGVRPPEWDARGLHRSRGVMTLDEIVEEFMVGHLEQHADQLEALGRQPA